MLGWLTEKPVLSQEITRFNNIHCPPAAIEAKDANYLVLDLELTGLHAKRDHIVSIGWVPIRQQKICLTDARYYLINSPVSVGQSAIYHGVHDKDLKQAHELNDVLQELLLHYPGYIFVAHHCRLDHAFLQIAFQRYFTKAPRMQFLDTMNIEWYRMQQQGRVMSKDALRLPQCLERHNLPVSAEHHALEDAYSCALLFLSQLKKSHPQVTLADLSLQSR